MKTWLLLVIAVLFVMLCSPLSWSIENPGVRNPIGPSTVPPSSIRSGLVSTPDPLNTTGNLLITGNVRRGMHFRDTVPYRSTTSFGSSLGTSSLSSFLRDTAGSEDFGRYSNKYSTQPYYSPAEMVTTMIPGRSGIFRPTGAMISTRAQQDTRSAGTGVFGLGSLPEEQTPSGVSTAATDLSLQGPQTQYSPLTESRFGEVESRSALKDMLRRSMSLSPRDARRLDPDQIDILRQGETSAVERFQQHVQEVRGKTQDSTTVLGLEQQKLSGEDGSFRYPNRATDIENLKSKFEMQTPAESATTSGKQTVAPRYKLPTLDEFTPSMDTSRQEDRLQQGAEWSGIGEESQTGQEIPAAAEYDNIIKSELGGVKRDTGYTRPDTPDQGQRNVLERIRQQLDDLTRTVENRLQAGRDGVLKAGSTERATKRDETRSAIQQYIPDLRAIRQGRIDSSNVLNLYEPEADESSFGEEELAPEAAGDRLNRADAGKQNRLEFPEIPIRESSQKESSPLDELSKLSQADLSAEAKRIMGPHRSLESYSEAKFNQHMRAAEDYLKAGRYYRAAGCFSLASIYKPDSHQALAGRGHALFAAGEYISSALFLSRALAIRPEYARTKIDLVTMLGDENKLAGRIADIEQWLARSGSSKLQFLLSYIYYQTGRFDQAKQAIDAASEKMPQSPAVNAIKTAIDHVITKP